MSALPLSTVPSRERLHSSYVLAEDDVAAIVAELTRHAEANDRLATRYAGEWSSGAGAEAAGRECRRDAFKLRRLIWALERAERTELDMCETCAGFGEVCGTDHSGDYEAPCWDCGAKGWVK